MICTTIRSDFVTLRFKTKLNRNIEKVDRKSYFATFRTYFRLLSDKVNTNEIINSTQLYLDPDLSLHNVALAVKLSDRVVSQAIKQNANANFSDYINKKRMEYAKAALRNTTKAEKNVLEILYEAGFNSKSVFNSQFKKHTGQSPTSYREMSGDKEI